MKTVIFDIETIPVGWETFDETSQVYLNKFSETEEDERLVKERMALWAPTNKIVAIGMLSAEKDRGVVYFQAPEGGSEDFEEGGIKYISGSEEEILERFWKSISFAQKFVTFNGRQFDCPVLMLKSAMLGVKPSKSLMPYRYSSDQHIDLLEQLTFYSTARKFNLDMFCKSFGIDSPKSHGVTGHDVKPLFEVGEYEKIARYCAGDLWATRDLYKKWLKYLKF